MNLELRLFQTEDLEEIFDWLEGWKMKRQDKEIYPSTGLIMYDKDTNVNIYAGFVWLTNSKLCQIGFITRNPFVKKIPKNTLKAFVHSLADYAKDCGAKRAMTWAEHPNLVKAFTELGFITTTNKTFELVTDL